MKSNAIHPVGKYVPKQHNNSSNNMPGPLHLQQVNSWNMTGRISFYNNLFDAAGFKIPAKKSKSLSGLLRKGFSSTWSFLPFRSNHQYLAQQQQQQKMLRQKLAIWLAKCFINVKSKAQMYGQQIGDAIEAAHFFKKNILTTQRR